MDLEQTKSTASLDSASFEKRIGNRTLTLDSDQPTSTTSLDADTIDFLRKKRTMVMDAAIRKHMSAGTASLKANQRPPPETAVKILADAMLNSPDDEKLQLKAIISLVRMSAKDDEREIIGGSDCIFAAIRAMNAFHTNKNILRKGCVFLANSAFECEMNKDKIREHGGIEMILRHASERGHDEDLQVWTFLALRNLTNKSEKNQVAAESFGAAELLGKGLKRYPENKSLQTHGVAAIASIAEGGMNCQMRLRESGCIDVLVSSMKKHISSSVFMEHCLIAVTNICLQNEKNQMKCWQLGIVEILADILGRRNSTPDLLLKICVAVRHLCFNKKIREDAGRAGLVNRLLEEQEDIRNHHGVEGADAILKALSNAVYDEEENMKIFTRCGGTEAMMNVLREHLANVEVLGSGLRLFRNICDETGVNYEYMKGSSVFKFSLDCIELFKDDPEITEHAFALISRTLKRGLADDLFGRSLHELRELVKAQLEHLNSNASVQKVGRALLLSIEAEQPEIHPSIIRKKSSLLIGKLKSTLSNAL